jgi:DNA topoisomerase-1
MLADCHGAQLKWTVVTQIHGLFRRDNRPSEPIDEMNSLRYVSDAVPGITRHRRKKGFVYRDARNRLIVNATELARIKALAIPPAWEQVWICPSASGHLQATGRDHRGRKQYRYHPAWRKIRDQSKYGRMVAFGKALLLIRRRVATDLERPGLPREKVLATIVRLLEQTRLRIGNREYAKANGSFGLTTLRNRHANIAGSELRLAFRGKGGKTHAVALKDDRLAKIVRRCRELPGYELFQYVDEQGQPQAIDSSDVNAYLRETTGQDFTAKDFRTWAGTLLAVQVLIGMPESTSLTQAKRNVLEAIKIVAELLGNTPAICRKSYIHPNVCEAYADGYLARLYSVHPVKSSRSSQLESMLLRLLRGYKPSSAPPSIQKQSPQTHLGVKGRKSFRLNRRAAA